MVQREHFCDENRNKTKPNKMRLLGMRGTFTFNDDKLEILSKDKD